MPLRLRQLDRQFARFCLTGEAEALAYVFDRTAGELLHVAAWLTRNRADADDLLQRTFLTAIEQRHLFAQQRRVQPWLLGILTNHARNLRRERLRHANPPVRARYRLTLSLQHSARTVDVGGLTPAAIELRSGARYELTIVAEAWRRALGEVGPPK